MSIGILRKNSISPFYIKLNLMFKIKNESEKFIIIIANDIFYVSLITFIFFSLIELARPRFISAHLNMSVFLMLTVIIGVIVAVSYEE